MMVTPLSVTTAWSLTVPSPLPPFWAAMSTITLPDRRRRAARDQCRGDDDVDVLALLGIQLGFAGLVVVAHLLGVTGARHLRLGRFDRQVLPAEGPDLIGHLRSRVGSPARWHPCCRIDGRQAG